MLVIGIDHVVDCIGNLLVHTSTWQDQVRTLREFFGSLQQVNFILRPTKCMIWASTIDFLAHRLKVGAIGRQEKKNVEKVRIARRPKTKLEFRTF
ncbi:transposon tf2-11 polyprotein [Plakobranchus ocellatus]|uniref:Transposon tf2-11 polyprotein n=1 Tax=Plakobranchus ocellatus TaxID=259542 RepID=A0AAV4D5E4_9GAST|nr:transposon tf2-11 polyprotein [Plakobranchus ocellatus]